MCGFVVIIDKNNIIDKESIADINNINSHRGPDSGNIYVDNNVALGSRRLRVHDLSEKSDQPFFSQCGKYVIVFNGAIYNYRELRSELKKKGVPFYTDSDTEVLLQGHIHYGHTFVKRLEGMFTYAIYNTEEKKVRIYRDHVGIKPLHYYNSGSLFIASSEIKPILSYPGVAKEINRKVLPEFFAFQSVMEPDTFFKNIYVFPSASHLTINTNAEERKIHFRKYWSVGSSTVDTVDKDSLEDVLVDNVEKCWMNDRRTGIQLSGGVDSSLITAWTYEKLKLNNIDTFSVIFNDNERKYYKPRSEENYIDSVSKKYKLNSNKYLFESDEIKKALPESIYYNEAPLTGPSSCLYYLLAKRIKDQVDIVITGEGADDIFNGYFNNWDYGNNIESHFKYYVPSEYLNKVFKISTDNDPLRKVKEILYSKDLDGMSAVQKTSVITIKRSLHALLARHDRMFMSNGVEGRPPFAAKNIIEARFSLGDNMINNHGTGKYVIKKIAEKYFDHKFVYRNKIGFSSPYGDWLSNKEYWGDYWKYLDRDLIGDLMHPEFLNSIIGLPNSKEKWTGGNLNLLMSVLNFQLWYSIFFNDSDKAELLGKSRLDLNIT